MSMQNPILATVRPNGLADTSVFQIEIDQEKASALGLSLGDINAALSTVLGSTYVNDFIDKNRVKKVLIQGDAPFRMLPEDVNRWYVRNAQGGMVPFSAFSSAEWRLGSPKLERFNGSPSVSILVNRHRDTARAKRCVRLKKWRSASTRDRCRVGRPFVRGAAFRSEIERAL
jgi:multidrug efflux pump